MRFLSLAAFAAFSFVPVAFAGEVHRSGTEAGAIIVVAQAASDKEQKQAFESAKELGTVEAWDAFLSNYPDGFYSDLARAYVKRLASEGSNQTQPNQPAQASPPQTAPTAPPLPTLDLGTDDSNWKTGARTVRIPGSIFNHQFQSAYVQSHGLELVTFCVDPRQTGNDYRVGMYIQETPGGGYPQFAERLRQGLARKPSWAGTDFKVIDLSFSNGKSMSTATARPGLVNGQWVLGPNGQTLDARSDDLENLMATNSVTISAPPLVATFQLDGSRDAICDVMNACGAPVPGCSRGRRVSEDTDSGQDAPQRCGRGRTWVGAQGKCVCVNDNEYWNGSRCIRRKKQAACTGGRTRDPQTGRCYCNGDSAWNGRACVVPNDQDTNNNQNNNNAQMKQAVCATLQIACSLGQQGACTKYNNGCP